MHLQYIKQMKKSSLLFNVFFILMNIVLNVLILIHLSEDTDIEVKRKSLEWVRTLSAVVMVLFLIRLSTFMNMWDNISPLIDIIYKIYREIKWFMAIFMITLICSAHWFYLIG